MRAGQQGRIPASGTPVVQILEISMAQSSVTRLSGLAVLASAGARSPARAAGHIAGRPGPEKTGGDYSIVTGKGYSLKIKSTGKHECAIVASQFFSNIHVRKVESNKVEVTLAGAYEMKEEGEAEAGFVAIRPGAYGWSCRNLAEKGLAGKFIAK